MGALKRFGLGILWAILFPLIAIGVVLVGIFGVFNFLVEFVIMVVNFFRGKKLFPVFPEDQQAYDILQRALDKKNAAESAPEPVAPQPVYVQQNFYSSAPLPPGYPPQGMPQYPPQNQIPQNYSQYPGSLPPGYQPQQIPAAEPVALPEPEPMPERPALAELPSYDASEPLIQDAEIGGENDD